jgi:indole-3-glycerol phosphate synthase
MLEEIIANKRKELARNIEKTPVRVLESRAHFNRETISMTEAILDSGKTGIIAEFKRKSPSKGVINTRAIIEEVTTGYFRSGAAALSVLTDEVFFGGTADDLVRTRELNPIPILRKDFIIDEYQVIEARAMGADAILLIAAVLGKKEIKRLARFAHGLQLQVLLEIHTREELDALCGEVDMVGVNNRDLKTFLVDTEISVALAPEIPHEFVRISESGIASALTFKKLKSAGYDGFLIGENFMRAEDPVVAFSDFVKLIFFDYDKG